jgi:hypothetical protein
MNLDEADALLRPDPLPLEMGIRRLDTGVLLVAARTDMPACTGAMFEWWFRFAPDTQQYSWWHPTDHVSSEWYETTPGTHVGSTHDVRERLGGEEVLRLHIQFHDPAETFSAAAIEEAVATGGVSGLVCARMGIGDEPPRDDRGRPMNGRMTHVARDTPFGMVLRSRFWLGEGLRAAREVLEAALPEATGLGLMKHANTEFNYLSRFLPSLYYAEQRDEVGAPDPW